MRNRKGQLGSAALEMLLSLPLVLTVGFGVIEFGRAFTIRQRLVTAAAEAAFAGSQSSCPRPTDADVREAASRTLASAGLDPSLADIDPSNVGGEPGTDVVVDVSYPVQFPFLSRLMNLSWLPDGLLTMHVRVDAENE